MRSRIPRFVLHPLRTKAKESSVSNMPLSEEESKDFDFSSQHSKRTISPNSLSSGRPYEVDRILGNFIPSIM